MSKLTKCVMIINMAVIVLQFCCLGFEIYRWNEIVGSIFSIVICLVGYFPSSMGESKERWFFGTYALLLFIDLIFQLVNMILLICFQWVVIQYCIHLNVSVDISEYGGVACNDWWHFGYGEINYRDRALIVTILLGFVISLRLIQTVLTCLLARKRISQPMYSINPSNNHQTQLHKRNDITTYA